MIPPNNHKVISAKSHVKVFFTKQNGMCGQELPIILGFLGCRRGFGPLEIQPPGRGALAA
jgi:hypothetical protein